ncbi:hypothetical protein J4E90_004184 [Alternaria incomplexa]|uniref:uncharacterized protein n=1 Tax=Alternaria incomplexa TaxID=1187928 RepID=UPI002220F571|nr:uncharacterized protein J4E90_004184 [Alternaria incomplexa]KAI4915738.1 hypothetical protein J4E90_004184 [Alternaria incomplexa]
MGESNMSDFAQQLSVQSWILYGIGMVMILLRTYARWHRVGSLNAFAADDWIMVTAVPTFYTGLIVCLNTIATGGGSNLFPPELFSTFTQGEIDERIKGSKIVVVSEQCMLNVIWSLKACMLFMFARMLTGTTNMKWIKVAALWVVIGWFAVQITFFSACRPFVGYWAVPPPNPQCTTLEHFAIVQATFNISSDVLIIAVPIPMIMSLSLPLKQKVVLGILFSMGIFVASVAVYVANLPGIWPLLREHIRFLREHTSYYATSQSQMPGQSSHGYGNLSRSKRQSRARTFTNLSSHDVELAYDIKSGITSIHAPGQRVLGSENPFVEREDIQRSDDRKDLEAGSSRKGMNGVAYMGVHIDTEVEIQSDQWMGSRLELAQSRVVRCEGPEAQAGR